MLCLENIISGLNIIYTGSNNFTHYPFLKFKNTFYFDLNIISRRGDKPVLMNRLTNQIFLIKCNE